MGQDFISTMVVTKADETPDWDAGKVAISELTQDDVDLAWLENFIYDIELDEDDNVNMEVVRERVEQALEGVRMHIDGMSRMLNTWTLFGHTLFIFGESSWGDADDVFDDVGILDVCPKVMKAIGFVTDFTSVQGEPMESVEGTLP